MGKSLNRVKAALAAAGHDGAVVETGEAKTAAQAAAELGCTVDQIAKSVMLKGASTGALYLFLTAGTRRVDEALAAALVGEDLARAGAADIRTVTGFAIGGVSPLGHLTQPRAFMDETLFGFDTIWAAAGTPHHVFPASPAQMQTLAQAHRAEFAVVGS